jgi:hypothetical protein
VVARGARPLDAAGLHKVRVALRTGTAGAAVAGAALAVGLFTAVVLAGVLVLVAGVGCALTFLGGYTVQVRAVARTYRTLPLGVPPVTLAATTLPVGVVLGVLAALAVAVPFGTGRTLALLAVGVGATALVTLLGIGFVCERAAVRQTRRPDATAAPATGRGSTAGDD